MTAVILALSTLVAVGGVHGDRRDAAAGAIEGRLLSSATSAPIGGAELRIEELAVATRTGADGHFRIPGLPEGRWQLLIRAAGFEERDVVVRVPAEGTVRLDLVLSPLPSRGLGLARSTGRITGTVTERLRGTAIPDARVALIQLGRETAAGPDGRFELRAVPPGSWTLAVEAKGYFGVERRVVTAGGEAITVEIALEPRPIPLSPLRVRDLAEADPYRIDAPSGRLVDSVRIDLAPVAVERDVFRAVQTLPSVTPASDYSSALLVRGGAPAETRIHLDGIPLHNPFHLGGFVSTFTPQATGAAVLRPGGLAASAASSLSGLLDVHVRRPGRDSLRVRGGVGLLSSSVTMDGPIGGGRGGFLLSGRRTYLDLATRGLEALGLLNSDLPYGFSDLLARLDYDLGGRSSLAATGYLNREGLVDQEIPVDAGWGSDALGLRIRGVAGDRLAWGLGAATSGFGADYFRGDEVFLEPGGTAIDSSLGDASVRSWTVDAEMKLGAGDHLLHAGIRWERHAADHFLRPDDSDAAFIPRLDLRGAWGGTAVFLRDRWSLGRWTLDAGLRAERARDWHVLPRARLERGVGRSWTVALAGGTYVQDWWGLRNQESALADVVGYELLVPVPEGRPTGRGWDVVLEGRGRVGKIDVGIDAYRKELVNVPSPLPSADPLDAPIILAPAVVRLGQGSISGLELSAETRLGTTSLILSYRFQHERRRASGFEFTPRTERPHRLMLAGTHPWGGRRLAFALTWMSGIPFTAVEAVLPGIAGVGSDGRPAHVGFVDQLAFGEANGERVRSYLRVDLGARDALDVRLFGRRGTLEPYVSVLNVLNRHNAFAVDHEFERLERVVMKLGPQLPILPSFGVRFRF